MDDKYDYKLEGLSKEQLDAVQKLATCKDAEPCLKKLMSIIDGQASCDDIKEFEAHIENCNGCFEEYDLNQAVRDIVAKSIKHRCVPEELKKSITTKLASFSE